MDVDKQELKDHIDCRSEHLKEKIGVLEKKTVDMGETLKEKIACERQQCIQRSLRNCLRDKMDFERKQLIQVEQLKGDMKHWLESRLSASCGQLHLPSLAEQPHQPSSSCNFDLTTRPANDRSLSQRSQSPTQDSGMLSSYPLLSPHSTRCPIPLMRTRRGSGGPSDCR